MGCLPNAADSLHQKRAGIKITHVPFKGSGPALAATLSGEVEIMLSGPPAVVTMSQAGRLRVLATSGVKRTPVLPDVPTFIESGIPIDVTSWYCLVVPTRTPQRIVERLHAALVDSLKRPQVSETLLKMGAPPEWSSPEQLRVFLRTEIKKFAEVVELAGARID